MIPADNRPQFLADITRIAGDLVEGIEHEMHDVWRHGYPSKQHGQREKRYKDGFYAGVFQMLERIKEVYQ